MMPDRDNKKQNTKKEVNEEPYAGLEPAASRLEVLRATIAPAGLISHC